MLREGRGRYTPNQLPALFHWLRALNLFEKIPIKFIAVLIRSGFIRGQTMDGDDSESRKRPDPEQLRQWLNSLPEAERQRMRDAVQQYIRKAASGKAQATREPQKTKSELDDFLDRFEESLANVDKGSGKLKEEDARVEELRVKAGVGLAKLLEQLQILSTRVS